MQPAAARSPAASAGTEPAKLRVMLVDDSAVIRGIFRRTLEADPGIAIVAAVSNGQQAVDTLARMTVDVIVLDIEMPVMDGMTALPLLLAAQPGVKIIMASTLTEKNAAVSLQALRIGAADYIPKPVAKHEIHTAEAFKRELLGKIKALGGKRSRAVAADAEGAVPPGIDVPAKPATALVFRKPSSVTPRIIAIGSSTGGPQALFRVFEGLKGKISHLPVVIAQHMPKAFTGILAEHLSKIADGRCAEGRDGEALEPGRIYIAPGDFHMSVVGNPTGGSGHTIRLDQSPPENYCRPSVEPLFRSVSGQFGSAALAVMLTGMGHDGLAASKTLVDAGGTLLAQDEKTSVVWGMPGAVASAGLCAEVLPIDQIAPHVCALLRR
tara:strand:- start:11 stop:1153 length:1143 start_codon:yes stop_codon:yes gene_type:complete